MFYADEANKIMKWRESDPSNPQLEALFDFLIQISKQLNLVHVILATSDYFLVGWLAGSEFHFSYKFWHNSTLRVH
jgi:hypothetical protein